MRMIEALGLNAPQLICFVGGGGKSSLMIRLAHELAGAGSKVLVTTTTKMHVLQLSQLGDVILESSHLPLIRKVRLALRQVHCVPVAGGLIGENKATGLTPETVDLIYRRNLFQAILVEADGAKCKAFKAPTDYEPVLPSLCGVAVVVVGIDILGCPLNEEWVHRPHIVSRIAGKQLGAPITQADVTAVLKYYRGIVSEKSPFAKVVPAINKVDDPQRLAAARQLARGLVSDTLPLVLITSTLLDNPVLEVVTA